VTEPRWWAEQQAAVQAQAGPGYELLDRDDRRTAWAISCGQCGVTLRCGEERVLRVGATATGGEAMHLTCAEEAGFQWGEPAEDAPTY
jgi:hypothetical protein